ncbi:hypothetical protein PI126_g11372 [Phytophthora idaei]|nr:hypothetical protein PI126_g11372 [Phytophthora idaei]
MDKTGNKMKWDAFWRYVRKTWMTGYGADLWNINSMAESDIDHQNRTNNPFEGYNRAFGDRFTVKHPNRLSFVETAKADARRFVQLIGDVKTQPVRSASTCPERRAAHPGRIPRLRVIDCE